MALTTITSSRLYKSVGIFAVAILGVWAVTALADVGAITVTQITGSGTGPYALSGTWEPQGNQCWNNGQGFKYSVVVFDDLDLDGEYDNGVDPIMQEVVPAGCNGDFEDPVDSADKDLGGAWPAAGQSASPATFNLEPGSHSICAVLLHASGNGNDIEASDCLDSPVVVPSDDFGAITITKEVSGDPIETWSFDFSGILGLSSLSNDSTSFSTTSIALNTYSVSEGSLPNEQWSYGGVSCTGDATISNEDDINNSVDITLDADGESANCTFTNVYTAPENPAILTIIKDLINDDFGGLLNVTDFSFSINGEGSQNFVENGSEHELEVGSDYSVVEDEVSGYNVSYSEGCSGTIGEEGATCTITNNDEDGVQITVTKVVTNDSGTGDSEVANFALFVGATEVTSGQSQEFPSDTYAITEDGPDGYVATYSGDCDAEGMLVATTPGETYTCTITNDDIPLNMGTIVVKKIVDVGDQFLSFVFSGSWIDQDFELAHDGSTTTIQSIFSSYSVGETVPDGWESDGGVCVSSGGENDDTPQSINLVDGEMVTCTFTNTQLPQCSNGIDDDDDGFIDFEGDNPDPGCDSADDDSEDALGSITIDKVVPNQNDDQTQPFSFDVSGGTTTSSALSAVNDPWVIENLLVGSYTIEEVNLPPNWNQSSPAVCYEGESQIDFVAEGNSVTFDLSEGQDVLCRFNNRYDAPTNHTEHIKILKQVTVGSNDQQEFTFDVSWEENIPALKHDQSHTSVDLNEDVSYSVSENVPNGWSLQGVSCTSDDPEREGEINADDIVLLSNGETVTCVFTNDQDDDGGGGGSSSGGGRSSSRRDPGGSDDGEVLGEQVSVLPASAPNTGVGGMAGAASSFGLVFSLLGGLGLFTSRKD